MNDNVQALDAIIIGAGIIRLYTAYYLQRAGWRVTVIDRGEPGMGCSSGNAGALSIQTSATENVAVISSALKQLLVPPWTATGRSCKT